MRRPWAAIFLTILLFARAIAAQSPALNEPRSPGRVEGLRGDPAPPLPPEVIARDDDGHATVRAIKLTAPLRVDGKLDEEVYQREQPFGGFIQVAPRYGAAADRADRRLGDVRRRATSTSSCRCWDSAPPDKWIANELRRDTNQLRQNDHFGVMLRHLLRSPQRLHLLHQPARRAAPTTRSSTRARRTPTGIRCGTSQTGRFEGGWTRGDGDPVQVAALHVGRRPGVGHPDAPRRSAARTSGPT